MAKRMVILAIALLLTSCTRVVVVRDEPAENRPEPTPDAPWWSDEADTPWWEVLSERAYKDGNAGWCPVCGEQIYMQARTPSGPARCRLGHTMPLVAKLMDGRLAALIREDYKIMSNR